MFTAVGFALSTRVALGASVLFIAALGASFFIRQQRPGRIGGRMAPSKLLWLVYALLVWFLVAPIVALDPSVSPPLRLALGTFSALMWTRGVAELLLMYVVHRWRPPWGIAHDLLCAAILTWQLALAPPAESPADRWALVLGSVIVLSLLVEAAYAAAFYRIVGRATEGEAAVWFASETERRFRTVVRITAWLNVPFYGHLVASLAAAMTGP